MNAANADAIQKPLAERWREAWPQALETWSKYTRLRDARLCASRVEAASEGLDGSFAMIRLNDQSVVVDLETVSELGLEDYALEILAHEVGHHILAPGNITDQFRLLARIRRGLPTLEHLAPMVANLYADLIINDRLQRQSELRLADVYRCLARKDAEEKGHGAVWNFYLRIYENLWALPAGELGAHQGDDRSEGDAWLGARLVRVYGKDWMEGAGRFAALLLHYLLADAKNQPRTILNRLMDSVGAAVGCEPFGGIDIDPGEISGTLHPTEDPEITGMEAPSGKKGDARGVSPKAASRQSGGQMREPWEYGEILRGAGIQLSDHEIAIRYYRERALPYLVPFPARLSPDSPEPQLEGLEPWEIGNPLDEIDWLQTVLQAPRVIPGLTTVSRQYGQEPGKTQARQPINLDLYVDSSGSMPDPQREISYPSLAGAIIALSALRSGASVQVTLWSGKTQFMHTPGFVRDDHEILSILTAFFGGGTCFPIHRLRQIYCEGQKPARPTHILMISDEGITTMFDKDELGNSGWNIASQALAAAGAGGSMALNIPQEWNSSRGQAPEYAMQLRHAQRKQGWSIHAVSQLEHLLQFARDFSRKHYA